MEMYKRSGKRLPKFVWSALALAKSSVSLSRCGRSGRPSVRKYQRIRVLCSFLFTLITNGFLIGFFKGQIYQGELKKICLPGLNCYACPGALGACPIGALQQSLANAPLRLPLYVAGSLLIFGALLGRFVCGWLCPIGLIQDLLHRLRHPFDRLSQVRLPLETRLWFFRYLRYIKSVVLVLFVFVLPIVIRDSFGFGAAWFCKYLCPSGVMLGGWPLAAANEGVRASLGWLFTWKSLVAGLCLFASVLIYRPFCKYLCPLGALYGWMNRIAIFQLHLDHEKCIQCGRCEQICPMQVAVLKQPNAVECIRCGRCVSICPTKALRFGLKRQQMHGSPTACAGQINSQTCPKKSRCSNCSGC